MTFQKSSTDRHRVYGIYYFLPDFLTGERNILRCDLMEDTGTPINPDVDVGQIEGSFVFALGWWLQVKLSQYIR